jgi:hypothetical protein
VRSSRWKNGRQLVGFLPDLPDDRLGNLVQGPVGVQHRFVELPASGPLLAVGDQHAVRLEVRQRAAPLQVDHGSSSAFADVAPGTPDAGYQT